MFTWLGSFEAHVLLGHSRELGQEQPPSSNPKPEVSSGCKIAQVIGHSRSHGCGGGGDPRRYP